MKVLCASLDVVERDQEYCAEDPVLERQLEEGWGCGALFHHDKLVLMSVWQGTFSRHFRPLQQFHRPIAWVD